MAKNCKHLNCELAETRSDFYYYSVVNGELDHEPSTSVGDYSTWITMRCYDCKTERTYSKSGFIPKWLRAHLAKLEGRDG